ncbi:MAG: peptidylprolyl isomerase [Oscillospiraceae bacterium]|nr:peptidylprolyl isomerase [Oscillospiraceae bacterium]
MSEKSNKKRNYTIAKIVVALCVVLCVVLTVFEMGFTYRMLKAAEVDGTEYSVAEYNWLYTNSLYEVYNNYYQSYGELAAYFINPQMPLDEQQYSEEETWADFIKDYTDSSLINITTLYNEAVANGFELEQRYYDNIDAEWEAMGVTAKSNGVSANGYAEASYGKGVNEEVFRSMYERYYTAYTYAEQVRDSEEATSAEIDEYYSEHAEDFDTVSYKYYYIDGSAEEGEDAEATMKAAKDEAAEIVAGTKEVTFSEYDYSVKANISSLYADWLFDEARVAGDKEVFESETAVYVVEFVEKNDLHYNTVDVRHVLVAPEDSSNETAWQTALADAEKYKAEWEEMGATEEAFAEIAAKYSVDSSAVNGGLYENVFKGQMVDEFEDWCFDSARKAGDSDIVKTSYGYHIMYFCGEAEEFYSYAVEEAIKDERYSEYVTALADEAELTELFGIRFGGKHYN